MTATFPPTSSPTFTPAVPGATPTPNVSQTGSNFNSKQKEPKKIFGMEMRSLATVLGLTLFFVLAMAGVVISLRQRFAPEETVAPNATESRPSADVVKEATCTLSWEVAPEGSPSPSPSPSVSPSPSPSVTPSPSPSPTTYACNSECTSNAQCATANGSYICTSEGRCRLESNTTSATCDVPQSQTYVCNSECTTNAQCATANANYICGSENRCRLQSNPSNTECRETTTVSVGCNDTCVTNSDCSNPDHICNDNKCRLASNPTSASCNPPTTTTTTTPTTPSTPVQPELPAELPKTGPEDWSNWLKGGLAALGVGAILLLLL